MKRESLYLQPRSAVVFVHTRRMLDHTALCVRKFAARVAELYIGQVAPDQRQVPFRAGVTLEDLFRAERHNAQLITRYMTGLVKSLPADLEDAWVGALPEPFRADCERELARRRGHVPVRLGPVSEAEGAMSLGRLMGEVGELCEALAPALADGRLTEADLPHARRILNESDDVIAAVLGLRRQVTALIPNSEVTSNG